MNPKFLEFVDRIKLALSYYDATTRVEGTVDSYYITGGVPGIPELYGVRIKMEFLDKRFHKYPSPYDTRDIFNRRSVTLLKHIHIHEDRLKAYNSYLDSLLLRTLYDLSAEILKVINHG